jgi:uncharacterized protein (DUF1330 family)
MKTKYKLAIALAAGAAIGGTAIQGLHAQAKPPIYAVYEVNVTDLDAYKSQFVPLMAGNTAKAGGHILAGTQNVTMIEGAPQALRMAVVRWDSMEQFQAYFNSAPFKEARKIGEKYVSFRTVILQGQPDSELK